MKNRISVTLSGELIKEVDKTVNGIDVPNRSFAIEKLLRERLRPKANRVAIILAGGEGTRLRPLTYEIPKPMIPIKGKPILEYIIDRLKLADVSEIVVTTGYKSDKVKEYFGNGEKFGVAIRYIDERTPRGTGGAVKAVEGLLHDDFFVINGDNLFDFNLNEIYEFHKKEKAIVTIGLTNQEDVSKFGVVELDGTKITKFIEKPKVKPKSHLINTGIHVINPSFFAFMPEGPFNMSKLMEKAAEKGLVSGFVYSGKWLPCDNLELYEKALKNWP
jgi:Nucleoside-diphosphate-sugar pyrophosphorylase involved in lipopolysaccharide biosynthesis/translation initiation factor 2B, gamma/epsilon subunits (eIF-2Bgamma/eIF-2Bepsilon)